MPRKHPSAILAGDFRTPDQRADDQELHGYWWRCPEHELTQQTPIYVGEFAYCPADGCCRRVILAHSGQDDPASKAQRHAAWSRIVAPLP